jgi:multiple sugar transport system permease protein
MTFPEPIGNSHSWVRRLYRTALPVSLVVWLLPLLGVAWTSIRSPEDLSRGNFWGWPENVRFFGNYAEALTASPFGQFLLNSFLITVPAVAATLVISTMAGFTLAKHRFSGSNMLLGLFLAGNFVPHQILMVPVRDMMIGTFPLYDTRLALIVFHTAFQTGFCTFFMANFIRTVPDDLIDAARSEGAGELAILGRIVVPLVRPALAALAVLEFTFIWNDYFWSLVLAQSDAVRPVTAGLQTLKGMYQASWNLLSAAAIMAALPPVAIFFLMQRHFVAGLTGEPRAR